MPEYHPERIIVAVIKRYAKRDSAALARAILDELWEAGYDLRPRPDATAAVSSRYSQADEPTGR
jgi:hypothetical protein